MAPMWSPDEKKSGVYEQVVEHSPGMISFEYNPAGANSSEILKRSRTYTLAAELERRTAARPAVAQSIPE